MYLRCSVGLGAITSGRQGTPLSQALGWITNHGLLLLLVSGVVVVITTVSLVVQHLTLVVGHITHRGVLHGGGVDSPAIKRGIRLRVTDGKRVGVKKNKSMSFHPDLK